MMTNGSSCIRDSEEFRTAEKEVFMRLADAQRFLMVRASEERLTVKREFTVVLDLV